MAVTGGSCTRCEVIALRNVVVALPQLVAHMGIVYTTRKELKQNSVVYGVSSDGRSFRFCRIDNDGVFVKSKLLEWNLGDKEKIYSIIRSLIPTAALSSPSTTPIKDPMRKKMVLASCQYWAEGLTINKYKIRGKGQVSAMYGGRQRSFKQKMLSL